MSEFNFLAIANTAAKMAKLSELSEQGDKATRYAGKHIREDDAEWNEFGRDLLECSETLRDGVC